MTCYVCDANDWEPVLYDGKPIHSSMTVQVCKKCGNLCHAVEPQSEAQIREFYRKEYRPPPTVANLVTTTHKLNYIRIFLRDFLSGKKGLVVGDFGCATGYLVNWFRQLGHRATGCELTLSYRRFAEHFYGVPITEDLEPKHRYDLITMYHVLEHVTEPDKKLSRLASMLSDGGHMMVSTPQWLDTLEEASGTQISGPNPNAPKEPWGFDHLFHRNHINLFTEGSIKNLFARCGLEVVKEDRDVYGQSYLLRKSGKAAEVVPEDPVAIAGKVAVHRKAIDVYLQDRLRDALTIEPKFPDAWLKIIFGQSGKDPEKQEDLWVEALAANPRNLRLKRGKAIWHYQREELDRAMNLYAELQEVKPNEDDYMVMGYCLAKMGRRQEAARCFLLSAEMSPLKWNEAMTWACKMAGEQPAWDEVARERVKDAMLEKAQQNGLRLAPRDPVMDGGGNGAGVRPEPSLPKV